MYADLETIANLKFGKAMEAISKETQSKLQETIAELTRRNISRGGFAEAQNKVKIDGAERLCWAMYEIWLSLIMQKKGRIDREDITIIMSKVEGCVASGKKIQASGLASATQEVEVRMAGVSGKIRRELEIKIREQDAFPRRIERVGDEVFVIAAALDDLKPLINEAIGPAIKDNTLQPFVMVAREPEGPIGNEILARIEAARLVVADLTYERQNCYYEVGYAHAKGKKVIFTARQDHDPRRAGRVATDPKIHFDLDNHRFSFWEPGNWSRLRVELRTRIAESLRRLETGATSGDRRGDAGQKEILTYLRETQSSAHGRVIFNVRAVAQELGWPVDDVEIALSQLLNKGVLEPGGGGYFLTEASVP